MNYYEILCRQIAIDYCCSLQEVKDERHHFTVHHFLEGRRRYDENGECFLKIIAIGGKLLFSGEKDILAWCKKEYHHVPGEWFFDAKYLTGLEKKLQKEGYTIRQVHPFFLPKNQSQDSVVITDKEKQHEFESISTIWYEKDEIEQFRGDSRFHKAFTFCETAPDEIGVAALEKNEILGMAGASSDSPTMWQIGINVIPKARGRGIAPMLVALLKDRLLEQGILPYYGTALSHVASQRTAHAAGFRLAWAELETCRK